MPLSWVSTWAAPVTLEGVLEPPPPPDWLITIRATITAPAANPAKARYWTRRLRARSAATSWDSWACRWVRRRSLSPRFPSMRGLYRRRAQVPPGVGEGAGRRDRQGERHQDGARHAPLAD